MTAIHVPDELIQQLIHWSGIKDYEKAIQLAVNTYIRAQKRHQLRSMKGTLSLDTDLAKLRQDQ